MQKNRIETGEIKKDRKKPIQNVLVQESNLTNGAKPKWELFVSKLPIMDLLVRSEIYIEVDYLNCVHVRR